ncbi:winged helix-turn-helix transcriptional regulator [Halopelagius longus]|uniref:Transcriptional regulator n=1 Tax=Halopelagius longus TaxID=1236180 RepID=A0A1H1BVN1_9EURY|nr:helix-turn-helix domain-containing protein [Halopelagius longus]RDI70939.1 transcriptional regulator [Halopelagius longus]SDQ55810.1 transcriptional regulator, HxlR family [Halopelagius longus]
MTETRPDDEARRRRWHELHDALSGKWTFHVLRLLDEEDAGFNELKRRLGGSTEGTSAGCRTRSGGITAKTLSERLRELRRLGAVEREVRPTSPPTTTYSLTPRGRRFAGLLREMESMVDIVPCDPCGGGPCEGEECDVATVDERATAAALGDLC